MKFEPLQASKSEIFQFSESKICAQSYEKNLSLKTFILLLKKKFSEKKNLKIFRKKKFSEKIFYFYFLFLQIFEKKYSKYFYLDAKLKYRNEKTLIFEEKKNLKNFTFSPSSLT